MQNIYKNDFRFPEMWLSSSVLSQYIQGTAFTPESQKNTGEIVFLVILLILGLSHKQDQSNWNLGYNLVKFQVQTE